MNLDYRCDSKLVMKSLICFTIPKLLVQEIEKDPRLLQIVKFIVFLDSKHLEKTEAIDFIELVAQDILWEFGKTLNFF